MEDDLEKSLVEVPANGSSSAAVNLTAEAGARMTESPGKSWWTQEMFGK